MEFYAKIDIQPQLQEDLEHKPYILVYLRRRTKDLQSSLSQHVFFPPLLVAGSIIPNNSPHIRVFDFIQDGDINGFQSMLESRDVSLWDCDSEGRSFITYAVFAHQPELCKYLIEHGADVDCIEPSLFADGSPRRPLLVQTSFEDFQPEGYGRNTCNGQRLRSNDCRRLLLEAGADPTVGGEDSALFTNLIYFPPPDDNFEGTNSVHIHNLIFQLGHHYINTKEHNDMDQTIFLQYCAYACFGLSVFVLDFLLQRGCRVDERDSNGNTCLHLALETYDTFYPTDEDDKEFARALVHIIQVGADVRSVNNEGETPSDVAHSRGRLISKLWDDALVECGIEIASMSNTLVNPVPPLDC